MAGLFLGIVNKKIGGIDKCWGGGVNKR